MDILSSLCSMDNQIFVKQCCMDICRGRFQGVQRGNCTPPQYGAIFLVISVPKLLAPATKISDSCVICQVIMQHEYLSSNVAWVFVKQCRMDICQATSHGYIGVFVKKCDNKCSRCSSTQVCENCETVDSAHCSLLTLGVNTDC